MTEPPKSARSEWKEALRKGAPSTGASAIERQRGLSFLFAALAAAVVGGLGFWAAVDSGSGGSGGRFAVLAAVATFWIVRRVLAPSTPFDDDARS